MLFCKLQAEGQSLTRSAMSQLQLSARVSSHFEVVSHDCRFGWKRRDTVRAFGGGAAKLPKMML
jgi:hypothetical protein